MVKVCGHEESRSTSGAVPKAGGAERTHRCAYGRGRLHANQFCVSPELQAKAARQASAAFLNEIPAFGKLGDRLHTFVFRLGLLFALAHKRPTQSEPEQSHFAITSGSTRLNEEDLRFMREAEKWSVNRWDEVIAAARSLCESSVTHQCDAACYDCLKDFGNQQYHDALDRNAVLQFLK